MPVFSARTMEEYIASSIAAPRFNSTLLSIFAAVALVLTIIGLYGVMSYSVAQRTNEIGIRMALGAQTRDVLGLIVKDGLKLVFLGLVLGISGALALTRLLSALLFGVTTRDPTTFVAIAVLLSLVAMLACYIPAWRATRVDPLEALRCSDVRVRCQQPTTVRRASVNWCAWIQVRPSLTVGLLTRKDKTSCGVCLNKT